MIGFLNVYKPSGVTSAFVVGRIKKQFHLDKVGHMGTLDPLACGILPIAIGKATRMFDYFLEKTKTYIARFTFGTITDTLDSDGQIAETSDVVPSLDDVKNILKNFTGDIEQLPPNYSAKKINGTCAYKLARQNVEFELKPKTIHIEKISLLNQVDERTFEFEIECGSGTYIRSLARDIAKALNTVGYMTFLERTQSGFFKMENSITLAEIEKLTSLDGHIMKIEEVFPKIPHLNLTDNETKRLVDGQSVNINALDGNYMIFCGCELICIGEAKGNNLKLKTYLKG